MNITAKSRYALKIMMDLTLLTEKGVQQRHLIAKRQGIPLDFMDQIMARLRAKDLIESTRGRHGGFQLKRLATEISLWDILEASEDQLYPVKCIDTAECDFKHSCISYDAWNEVFTIIRNELCKKTLQTLVDSYQDKHPKSEFPLDILPSGTMICAR